MTPEKTVEGMSGVLVNDQNTQTLYAAVKRGGPFSFWMRDSCFSDDPKIGMTVVVKAPRRRTKDGYVRLVLYPRRFHGKSDTWAKLVGTTNEPAQFKDVPKIQELADNYGVGMACSLCGSNRVRVPHPKVELIKQNNNWSLGKLVGVHPSSAQQIVNSAFSEHPHVQ